MDKCFLSISLGIGQFDAQTSQKLAMANHDELAQVIAKYPHRFGGYAVLPMHDTEFAVKELTRCHDELGYFGWNAFSNFGDKRLDDKACFPVLERAVQLKLMCRKVTQENLIDISLLFRENLQNGIDRLRNAAYTKSYQNNLI